MDDLTLFVRDALSKGESREQIRGALRQALWPEDEIQDALNRFADIPFAVPVPSRRHSGSARDAFLYLVTFVSLYVTGIALGSLLFGLVDHFLPDPLQDRYMASYESDMLRWDMAMLIVAFPILIGLTRYHLKSYVVDPERRTSGVRRWLTYLTLFVAADVVIGTLIALIGNVLGGEIAARFLLKCAVALLISGAVFVFYLWELRYGDREAAR